MCQSGELRWERAWVCSNKQPVDRISPTGRSGGCGSPGLNLHHPVLWWGGMYGGRACWLRVGEALNKRKNGGRGGDKWAQNCPFVILVTVDMKIITSKYIQNEKWEIHSFLHYLYFICTFPQFIAHDSLTDWSLFVAVLGTRTIIHNDFFSNDIFSHHHHLSSNYFNVIWLHPTCTCLSLHSD